MAVRWTEEQQRVIDVRGCNVLVSAAAGSGKTAVLVARILSIIMDEHRPVDIDRLLVVTFTNAAAAEMRERIRDALELRAESEPDNVHLQRQLVLVHNAKITTIHSFCLHVLRNHFQTAGIDPSFRVADEGEVLLLEQETVKEVIEEAYADGGAEFSEFLESVATGKNDAIIEELVLQLYHFALGQPWPQKWLRECCAAYGGNRVDAEGGSGDSRRESELSAAAGQNAEIHPLWLRFIEQDTQKQLSDIRERISEAIRIAEEPDGPYPYVKTLEADLELVDRLRSGKDYCSCSEAFRGMGAFSRLSAVKDKSVSEEKKLQVQAIRGEIKDAVANIRKAYYYEEPEILREEFIRSGVTARALTRLAEAFMERLAEKKAEKNILDFGDLEHLALQVLSGPDGPTDAAREYAEAFEEIMIDEYQDSNLVQELILNSVAGRGRGEPNRFMVGDVKQSIYRFRLARPELFLEKYKAYDSGPEKTADDKTAADAGNADRVASCRIDLHRNFRSRAEVLDAVNYIFRQIMTEEPGGIVYDEDAALYPGASFEPVPEVFQGTTAAGCAGEDSSVNGAEKTDAIYRAELWLVEADTQTKQRDEAALVGERIREIVGSMPVWDREQECYRPARYSDIVILLRTVSGWADTFGEVLGDMGIPCFTGSQKGYFSASEIRTVLAYLQILDNPVQDIPLAAVLRSAIGGLDDEALAKIRIFSKRRYFYDCVQEYRKNGPPGRLKEKLEQFFTVFERLREKAGHTPVHLLLWEILDVTGYGEYAAALPAGRQRKANLDMLVEKAIAYEATSYRGLFHFVRYIESLKKYEVDYGEASIGAESADTVRIMSIHKSKGLEFPIVFVSGLGKQFNESDSRSRVILHPEYGIGCDYVDLENRTRQATLLKRAIRQKTIAENLGEELRVLYVAMTRAKEKLILTGSTADAGGMLEKWMQASPGEKETLSYSWLSSASTCLDWVMPALLHGAASEEAQASPGGEALWVMPTSPGGEASEEEAVFPGAKAPEREAAILHRTVSGDRRKLFDVYTTNSAALSQEAQMEESGETIRLQELLAYDASVCRNEEVRKYLEETFEAVYPHETVGRIPGKMSVSELKKLSQMPEEEDAMELYRAETVIPLIPRFRGRQEAVTGAARGTVYHAFMENLDFKRQDVLEIQLEELVSCGKMSGEESEALDLSDIRTFLSSSVGRRMEAADARGRLFREQPFVLGVPAGEINDAWDAAETVLVQGIIDAYFEEEDGGLVLLDYKTDRVSAPHELTDRYRAQLDYYAAALERLTGRRVKERLIYSFCLEREITL